VVERTAPDPQELLTLVEALSDEIGAEILRRQVAE
jgi:hypothetical protein